MLPLIHSISRQTGHGSLVEHIAGKDEQPLCRQAVRGKRGRWGGWSYPELREVAPDDPGLCKACRKIHYGE